MGHRSLTEIQGLTKHHRGRPALVDVPFGGPRRHLLGLRGPGDAPGRLDQPMAPA